MNPKPDQPSTQPAIIQVVTTVASAADARRMATQILDGRLAACVQIDADVQSIFRWNGVVEEATEQRLTMKTIVQRLDALQTELLRIHPYDVPEILVTPVIGGHHEYFDWVAKEVD